MDWMRGVKLTPTAQGYGYQVCGAQTRTNGHNGAASGRSIGGARVVRSKADTRNTAGCHSRGGATAVQGRIAV